MGTATAPILLAVLEYASHGDPVFPVWHAEGGRCGCRALDCNSPAKHPIANCAPNGLKDATTDEAVLREWWRLFPQANVATRTGITRTVLDIDPAKGGHESLARLEHQHGALPATATTFTGGGGEHRHFLPVPGLGNSAGKIGPGLDIRGEDGQVLLPPSNHVRGVYLDDLMAPLFETPPAPMPAWLVARAMAPTSQGNGNGHHRTSDEWGYKLVGAPKGQRRAIALELAGHYLGLHIAPEEVESILLGYAARCTPPFPEREARELVRDLARRDRQRAQALITVPAPGDGPILVRLDTVAPTDVRWHWPGKIARGKITLLIGEPGSGKSTAGDDIAARTTRGLPWPDGGYAEHGDVVMLAAEDGLADTVRPHIDRQGGDPARVHVLRAVRVSGQECPFSLERDLPALEAALTSTRAVLLIISPLSAYLGNADSFKDSEVRGLLDPLAALAERLNVAVIAIMHLTKAQQRRLLNRAQGSVAFVALARVVVAVGEDREHPGSKKFLESPPVQPRNGLNDAQSRDTSPPGHLRPATRRWWAQAAGDWNFEEHHRRLLTLAGEHWDRATAAREALARHGLTFTDRFGTPKPRPEVAIARDATVVFARLLRELRLDVEPDDPRPPGLSGGRNHA